MGDKDDDTIIFNDPSTNKCYHDEDGETLFEKYFKGVNITADKRNYCYMILNNIREVVNSRYVAKYQSNRFELGSMTFGRLDYDKYFFNGVISNGEESKVVDGTITIGENGIKVDTNFYRFYEFLEDDERFYSTEDRFIQGANGCLRVTRYSDCREFAEPAEILKGEDAAEYAFEKSKSLVHKKRNEMSN